MLRHSIRSTPPVLTVYSHSWAHKSSDCDAHHSLPSSISRRIPVIAWDTVSAVGNMCVDQVNRRFIGDTGHLQVQGLTYVFCWDCLHPC
jgi:hypothetical protein